MYTLDATALMRSIVHLGSEASLAPLVAKLQSGQPITVGVLGASVSLNGGCDQQPSRRCIMFDGAPSHLVHCYWGEPRDRPFKGFYVKFMSHINATWPHPRHQLNNSAADTTPPQAYLDYCFFTHLPRTIDLVFLEFGSMAASASFPGVEAIVRVLLSLSRPPALAFLTVREWCKASLRPWGSAPPYGPSSVTKHSLAEAAFTRLCVHYNQSCISYHAAVAPYFYANAANFSMADIAGDCLHPNRGRLGNEYMTDLLVHWLRAAATRVDSSQETRPPEQLPAPLFEATAVLRAQSQTRNERCYGFGALGGVGRQRYQRLLSVAWHTAHCPPHAGAHDAPLSAGCASVDEAPDCPTRLAVADADASSARSKRRWRGSLTLPSLPAVWTFCRQAILLPANVPHRATAAANRTSAAAAATTVALATAATAAAATTTTVAATGHAGKSSRRPAARRQLGLLATQPGATLDLPIDTRLAEFRDAQGFGPSSESGPRAIGRPPAAAPSIGAQLQYYTGPWRMGIVTLRCLASSGCDCAVQRIDAHSPSASALMLETHAFPISGAAAACILRLSVTNASHSGGHVFKIRQLTLTGHRAMAMAVKRTNAATGGAIGDAREGLPAYGGTRPSSGSAHKTARATRRQREMIKRSYSA